MSNPLATKTLFLITASQISQTSPYFSVLPSRSFWASVSEVRLVMFMGTSSNFSANRSLPSFLVRAMRLDYPSTPFHVGPIALRAMCEVIPMYVIYDGSLVGHVVRQRVGLKSSPRNTATR